MTITARMTRRHAAALRAIDERVAGLAERDGRGPLVNYEVARIGNALADAGVALSRQQPPLIPFDWPGAEEVPYAEAVALLETVRAALTHAPRPAGHPRNRLMAEIPAHYGVPQSYPRARRL